METPETPAQRLTAAQKFKERAKVRQQQKTIELPSGLVVVVKFPDVEKMLKSGLFPADLITKAVKTPTAPGAKPKVEVPELTGKNTPEFLSMIDAMVIASLVEPKCVQENPAEDEITLDMLDFNEKAMIANAFGEEAMVLDSFRGAEQTNALGTGSGVPEVSRTEAERLSEPGTVGSPETGHSHGAPRNDDRVGQAAHDAGSNARPAYSPATPARSQESEVQADPAPGGSAS